MVSLLGLASLLIATGTVLLPLDCQIRWTGGRIWRSRWSRVG